MICCCWIAADRFNDVVNGGGGGMEQEDEVGVGAPLGVIATDDNKEEGGVFVVDGSIVGMEVDIGR